MKRLQYMLILLSAVILLLLFQCSPQAADDDLMVINRVMPTDAKSLDPVLASDTYSASIIGAIYQPLYEYHYLKRPYELTPLIAQGMPEICENEVTYTISIKEGIYFQDDISFPDNKGRELVADDFVYSFKRIADVNNRSTGWWIFDDRIVGLNEFREYTSEADTVDYSRDVEGLKALDDYTLQITLTRPFPQFVYLLAMPYTVAVPQEAVEYHGNAINRLAVGTGPFMLEEWRRGNRIILKRNPHYWNDTYPTEGMPEDEEAGLLADAGKQLPFVDRVNVYIYKEPQTMWLNFRRGNLDIAGIPPEQFSTVIDENRALRPEFKEEGIQLFQEPSLDLTYLGFNWEDPDIGGQENVHLRKAIAYAYNVDHIIEHLYNHRAQPAVGPIPPGLFGYNEDTDNPWASYDVTKAAEQLVKAGYPDGDGAPVLTLESSGGSLGRQMSDYFVQALDEIGLDTRVNSTTFPDMLHKLNTRQAQVFGLGWGADYPDAENFLQLFYGPNESPGSNHFNYKNEEYDELYRKMAVMRDSPERQELIDRMVEILIEDVPCIFLTHRVSYVLQYPWIRNFKPHEMATNTFKYLKVDKSTAP